MVDRALSCACVSCARHHITLRLAERALCTDNAAMVGILAERKLRKGVAPTEFDAEIQPGGALGQ